MKRILVTGATGTLGRALVPLIAQNATVRLMSRKPRPDELDSDLEWIQADLAASNLDLDQALSDVDIVIHAATNPAQQSQKVDLRGTERLVTQALKHNISHFMYPSIIGIEEIPMKYYDNKRKAESIIEESGIPHTILRTTQFHQLIDMGLHYFNKLPAIMLLPKEFQFQSIDPTEVAQKIAANLGGGPAGRLPDFCGPEVKNLNDMTRSWFEARGIPPKKLINLPIPGKTARAFRKGLNTSTNCQKATRTWADWLMLQYEKERRNKDKV